jgi:hypothetical protein
VAQVLAIYKKKAKIGVGLWLLATAVSMFAVAPELATSMTPLAVWARAGSYAILVWGSWNWAKGKGHHGAWGFLGLLVVFLPDRHKGSASPADAGEESDAGPITLVGIIMCLGSIYFISGPGKEGVGGVSILILPGFVWGWVFLIFGIVLVLGGIATGIKGRAG